PQQSTFADPQIRRYTLTDGPVTSNSINSFNSEQDTISQAVNKLLQSRYSGVDGNSNEMDELDAPSHVADDRPLSRESSASAATVKDGNVGNSGDGHVGSDEPLQQPPRAPTVPPYQPGQLLPTIVTGETLNLDEYGQEVPNSAQ